jgi:hypothetical protein
MWGILSPAPKETDMEYIVAIETADAGFSHERWAVELITVIARDSDDAQDLVISQVEARGRPWAHRHVMSVRRV